MLGSTEVSLPAETLRHRASKELYKEITGARFSRAELHGRGSTPGSCEASSNGIVAFDCSDQRRKSSEAKRAPKQSIGCRASHH